MVKKTGKKRTDVKRNRYDRVQNEAKEK